ncbi:hypothetical protein ACMSEZ_07290 [Bacteroides thetaiotaomicron]|uniref:hypothetical protein n=1 Tax=Bacteroides thetaiotaomicron TaxID=818 RepID=UPI0039C10C0B
MKKIISIILYLLTLSSGYIILTIGLGWFWTIGSCENADRINQVLLNLSYSYIAGWIFYLLVTYFPEMQRKITLRPAIQLKIEDLRKQINACIQTFAKNEDWHLVDTITREQLVQLITNADMYANSYYASIVGFQQNHLQFLHATRSNVFELIEQILFYKEYLSAEQLLLLEKIQDSTYFHLTKVYENTPLAKIFYSSDKFKNEMVDDLYDVITHMRNLCKSFK